MNRYLVELAGKDGLESRVIDADSQEALTRRLLADGLTPLNISPDQDSLLARLNRPIGASALLKPRELALFSSQLSELLAGGLRLHAALAAMSNSRSKSVSLRTSEALLDRIREGAPLSLACEESKMFPSYYAGVIRAAEQSGRSADALSQLALHFEHIASTRSAVVNAMLYPFIVLLSTIASLLFVLLFVVPEFASIFNGETARLPWITIAILWASEMLTEYGVILAILSAAAIAWVARALKQSDPHLKHRIADWFTAKLPFLELHYQLEIARVLKMLGMMLSNGVKASEALAYLSTIKVSPGLFAALKKATTNLREGRRLSEALNDLPRIPESCIRLVEVGEQTATLGPALNRSADLLERECRTTLNRLLAIMNPVAILTLGGLVALVISGVMLGILSINQLAIRG